MRFCDQLPFGFGWITDERVARTSHALAADGGVWLVDPVAFPEAEELVRSLGQPRGVVQLLDRHARDCAAWAERLGVPHHVVPFGHVEGAPFELLPIRRGRLWQEAALWWPKRRVLVCADALGTLPYFTAPGERIGLHPFLRLAPPRVLRGLDPELVLVGHGLAVDADAAAAVDDALSTARRRLPGVLRSVLGER
jgi:hypothetical protein